MSLWIPVHQTLVRHPKLRRCARALDVDNAELIGRLVMLWTWALDYAADGHIHDREDIIEAMELTDPEEPGTYVDCLVDFGFLDVDDEVGGYRIHDWYEYGGKATVAKVERKADGAYGNHVRWHVNEGRVSPDCAWCSLGESPPDREGNRRAEQNREDKNREQQLGDEPTRAELYDEARRLLEERKAEGYQPANDEAMIHHLAQHSEVKHRVLRKRWATA